MENNQLNVRRNCLITGASAGIGKAFAYEAAARGYDLILVARREEKLLEIASDIKAKNGANSFIITADLALPNASKTISEILEKNNIEVDCLINNAGFGLVGTYDNTTWESQNGFIQLMCVAPCELTHILLPKMRARNFGRIINVASLAGIIPSGAGHTLYGAVKAFLIKFSQSLNAENFNANVKVSALCPGFTYSEFHDVNGTRQGVSKLPSFLWQTSEEVVSSAFEALERNQAVFVPGFANKIIAALSRILPDPVSNWIINGQMSKFRKT